MNNNIDFYRDIPPEWESIGAQKYILDHCSRPISPILLIKIYKMRIFTLRDLISVIITLSAVDIEPTLVAPFNVMTPAEYIEFLDLLSDWLIYKNMETGRWHVINVMSQ